jgi:hypothetical protein
MGDLKTINRNQDSSHGGKRAGAGRKRGSVTKKTREIADKAHESGLTPLDVMLGTMRELWAKAEEGDKITVQGEGVAAKIMTSLDFRLLAAEVAQKAAPFVHAKLANVQGSVDLAVTGRIETITRRIVRPQ